jgi:hypothetical protein
MADIEAMRTYESMKSDLLRSFPGQFALVCGQRLVGVYASIDEAMVATSQAFDEYLPAGTPILITEIAEPVTVRITATPFRRAPLQTAVARP